MSVFKATLIESPEYYTKRRWLMIAGFVFSILWGSYMGGIVNFQFDPGNILFISFVILSLLLVFGFSYRDSELLKWMKGKRKIEVSIDRIKIVSKSGKVVEIVDIDNASKIIVKDTYQIAEENVMDFVHEIKGNYRKNYIEIENDTGIYKYEFVIESYYMIEQLKKIIAHWNHKGYPLETAAGR
jgi:hypothetical protein